MKRRYFSKCIDLVLSWQVLTKGSSRLTARSVGATLAPFAMCDDQSRGRRHSEAAHPYRSEFQRDRDRIVHTKAFRRLENKTQVFAPLFSDHFRTRLTHTLEVTQVSTTIARAMGLNTDLCEVLALSHDIGHPPFGHEGEKVLDRIMKTYGSGFDHNLHALRIVEDFEVKYPAFRGLNLTYEVREGIIKHSSDWEGSTQSYVDLSEYEPGVKPPLEAQVIDPADEIAYNAADLDDGYRSGVLRAELMRGEVPLFARLSETVRSEYPRARERIWVGETLRRLIDCLVTDLIEFTLSEIRARGIRSVEDVRRQEALIVSLSPATSSLNQGLKHFLNERLYDDPTLKQARRSAQELIERLFGYYLVNPQALPDHHRSRLGDHELPRVVCDYIAGMTDGFAEKQFDEVRRG